MSSKRHSLRRRSSSVRQRSAAVKLFDYFVVINVKRTDFNAPTDKEYLPNAKDLPWASYVSHAYNSEKVKSASNTATSSTTSSSNSSFAKYSQLHTTKDNEDEEHELMEQMTKFSFCDLSDLVNKLNALKDKDKQSRKYYKILSFKHSLQSEKFTFIITKSNGTRLYGHCRRLFTPDVDLKASEMPTALVLISSHRFHALFDQIMDHIVARWFICHQAIFPILDALLLQQPPALGDTFRVTVKSQVSKDDEVLTFKLNSTYHISLKRLFQTLSVDNILWLISCVLAERRVIFYCNSLETLSECIHGLLALIYPFRWQHIFVPVLPESLINYLAAPMPFIIGIKSYLAHSKTEFEICEVVLVDLDKQSVRSTNELTDKLKPLPSDPCWKLKRELKKIIKRSALSLQTHNEYRQKYGNYNYKSFVIPKISTNMEQAAKGWDDLAIYNAFLAFFVLFIGDWRNFYDESTIVDGICNVPKPPYHLSSEYEQNGNNDDSSNSLKQSTTATSYTPPPVDEHNQVVSGQTANMSTAEIADNVTSTLKFIRNKIKKKIKDEAKRREVTKDNKMYYNAEAMEYIELLCQSQLFQTWFVRQQKEASDSVSKVSGIQDRYDYVMHNFNRIGASYSGCYKYLCQDSKWRNANHHIHTNLKQVIELTASFTSNRDYTALMQQQKSIQLTLHKLSEEATRPVNYEAIRNIILYRLNECYGKNNHPHGLMALYLLLNLIENSTDRILVDCMNHFVFYANVLEKYEHEKPVIAKQMNKIANEVVKLSTRLEEIKKKKIEKYVAFRDDYEYKYEKKKKKDHSKSKTFIDDKIAHIDFDNIRNNKQDQSLLGTILHSNDYNDATNLFTEVSQFRADNVQNYRDRCLKGEVRCIPPFEHLRNEFGQQMPDGLLSQEDSDDILQFLTNDNKEKQLKKIMIEEKASDFALNILNSFSPISSKPSEPKLNGQQMSIFDMGNQLNTNTMESNASLENNEQSPDEGIFLTRTDTKRDHTKLTLREFNQDWVNFDDDNDEDFDENDEEFQSSFFSKKQEEQSSIEAILFQNSDQTSTQKTGKVKRIKSGLGNIFSKAKEKGLRVKLGRKNSKSEIFGIDDVNPIQTPQTITPIDAENDGFDPLSFFGAEKTKASTSNHSNNQKKTNQKQTKAAAIFGDFDFTQEPNTKRKPTPKQDTFGDLFGDLSSNNHNDNNVVNKEPALQKQSVKDLMQTAYNQPKTTKSKASSVFDDLFD